MSTKYVGLSTLVLICVTLINTASAETEEICLERAKKFTADYKAKNVGLADENFKKEAAELFKDCIVNFFGFKMLPNQKDDVKDNYIEFASKDFPTFAEKKWSKYGPLTDRFLDMATAIELFLTKAGKWESIVKDKFFKDDRQDGFVICKNLLYVVAARYAYYTNVLYRVSDRKITLCKKDGKTYVLPENVCYPENAGSLTCTSDADVGLIGKLAGDTVDKYNAYMRKLDCAGEKCESDSMMDNNMYAFSLELATPEMFIYKDKVDNEKHSQMVESLKRMGTLLSMQLMDLVQAALQSVRQDDRSFYDRIQEEVLKTGGIPQVIKSGKEFANLLDTTKEKPKDIKTPDYGALVKEIGQCIYDDQNNDLEKALVKIRNALVTATGSYHSFGALRTIVVAMQMKNPQMIDRLSLNDYIASAIENLGYAQAKIKSCKKTAVQCVTDAGKYVWRTLANLYTAEEIFEEKEGKAPDTAFDVFKAREFVAELYMVYMKPKRELGEEYVSQFAFNDQKVGMKKKSQRKKFKSADNLEQYLKCSEADQCIKNLQDACVEYGKAMVNLIKPDGVDKDSKDGGKNTYKVVCDIGKEIVSKDLNKDYFQYVTKGITKIAKCVNDFENGGGNMCTIL